MLVVGPNPTFLRYIEHVLPSLDESGVELSTVSGLFGGAAASGREDEDTARLKGDARMARVVARAVADRERPLRRTVEIPFGRPGAALSRRARRPGRQPPPSGGPGPTTPAAERSRPSSGEHLARAGPGPAGARPPSRTPAPAHALDGRGARPRAAPAARRWSPPSSGCGRC